MTKLQIFAVLSDFREFCPIIHYMYEKKTLTLHNFYEREKL